MMDTISSILPGLILGFKTRMRVGQRLKGFVWGMRTVCTLSAGQSAVSFSGVLYLCEMAKCRQCLASQSNLKLIDYSSILHVLSSVLCLLRDIMGTIQELPFRHQISARRNSQRKVPSLGNSSNRAACEYCAADLSEALRTTSCSLAQRPGQIVDSNKKVVSSLFIEDFTRLASSLWLTSRGFAERTLLNVSIFPISSTYSTVKYCIFQTGMILRFMAIRASLQSPISVSSVSIFSQIL